MPLCKHISNSTNVMQIVCHHVLILLSDWFVSDRPTLSGENTTHLVWQWRDSKLASFPHFRFVLTHFSPLFCIHVLLLAQTEEQKTG